MKLKKRIYTGLVRPAIIYGAEIWSTSEKEEKRLNVNEMKMLCRLCGLTLRDRVQNKFIRGSRKVTEISKKIQGQRIGWFGHVEQREEDQLKRLANMEISGSCRRGRLKTRWMDSFQRDMKEAGVTSEH